MEEEKKTKEDKRTDVEKIVDALIDISCEISSLNWKFYDLLREEEKQTACLEAIARR